MTRPSHPSHGASTVRVVSRRTSNAICAGLPGPIPSIASNAITRAWAPRKPTISVAIALASGVILGEYVAQPLKREARRLESRLAGPRLVGPYRAMSRAERRSLRKSGD